MLQVVHRRGLSDRNVAHFSSLTSKSKSLKYCALTQSNGNQWPYKLWFHGPSSSSNPHRCTLTTLLPFRIGWLRSFDKIGKKDGRIPTWASSFKNAPNFHWFWMYWRNCNNYFIAFSPKRFLSTKGKGSPCRSKENKVLKFRRWSSHLLSNFLSMEKIWLFSNLVSRKLHSAS